MDTSIKTQVQQASVKQFNCQNCGAAQEVMHPRAQYVACQYCGSVLDAQSEEHQILKSLGTPTRHKPMSFIRLGQYARFHDRIHQVISRSRWRMNYKEYWSEEGETGYSNEVWIYDEWLLMDENRTYFYLIEDREGYYISEEIIPETPSLVPKNLRMSFFKDHNPQIVREYGEASLIFFEGESNYQIKHGDLIRFGMYKLRGIDYSVEYRMSDQNKKEIKEIEYFREAPISRRKVLEAFDENPEIEQLKLTEEQWRGVRKISLVGALAMLLLMLYSIAYDGQTFFSRTFSLQDLSEENALISEPIEVTEPGLFRMDLQATSVSTNSEMFIFAYILDSEQAAINKMEGSFYYYTGVEDGERWTESDVSTSKIFRLEEPGTYYVQLYKSNENVSADTVSVIWYKDVWLSRYFLFGLIIFSLLVFYASSKIG
ncbi:MAG: hypothetical protein AAFR61_10665 [Bacteroidota bacterium]